MTHQSLFHVLDWSGTAEALRNEVNKMIEGMNVVVDTLFLFERSNQRDRRRSCADDNRVGERRWRQG